MGSKIISAESAVCIDNVWNLIANVISLAFDSFVHLLSRFGWLPRLLIIDTVGRLIGVWTWVTFLRPTTFRKNDLLGNWLAASILFALSPWKWSEKFSAAACIFFFFPPPTFNLQKCQWLRSLDFLFVLNHHYEGLIMMQNRCYLITSDFLVIHFVLSHFIFLFLLCVNNFFSLHKLSKIF